MKKAVFGIILILAFSRVQAQDSLSWMIRFNTGVTNPVSPKSLAETHIPGFNVGLALGKPVSRSVQIFGHLQFNQLALDRRGAEANLNLEGYELKKGNASALTGMAGLRKSFLPGAGKSLTASVSMEAGFFHLSRQDLIESGEEERVISTGGSETAFGLEIGLALDHALDVHSSFFIELKPSIGWTRTEATFIIPVQFGLAILLF
ncbi:hypothetical protein JW906_13345 [bacterium]|nr:hypothetical protein [bacterium]